MNVLRVIPLCGGYEIGSASLLNRDAKSTPAHDRRVPSVLLPYVFYLIEHSKSLVLFDCGARPDVSAQLGPELGANVQVGQDDVVTSRLRALGCLPRDVDIVVVSHLHYDHGGGLDALRCSEVYLSRTELEFAMSNTAPQREAYLSEDVQALAHCPVRLVEDTLDIFGDGSLVIIPLPGHTPGHQGLLVRLAGSSLILAGDASYRLADLRARRPSGYLWDEAASLATFDTIEAIERSTKAEIVLSHDPASHAALPTISHQAVRHDFNSS
ncbi:MAG: N-acyl homoserine lactonase family protein [Acidimicrobiales bacterium]